jgi:fructose-specific component phosphotransferase system IIB-like protein
MDLTKDGKIGTALVHLAEAMERLSAAHWASSDAYVPFHREAAIQNLRAAARVLGFDLVARPDQAEDAMVALVKAVMK